jgi:hypothetical protein
MKPLQVYLSDGDAERLTGWARARRLTKSEAVRQAVRALVGREEEDPFFAVIGILSGGPRDGSTDHDRYLVEALRAQQTKPQRTDAVRRRRRLDRRPRKR